LLNLIETGDKSFSIRNEILNETYHSVYGAESESLHVFIKNGLDYAQAFQPVITVLEIGLGTGLNVILSCEWLERNPGAKLIYHTLEPFPLSEDLVLKLIQVTKEPQRAVLLQQIHTSEWGTSLQLNSQFTFLKHKVSLEEFEASCSYSLVLYDAFGPQAQPEMWTEDMIRKSTKLLQKGGVWVSYCAKGQVRRNLINCGMKVERLAGPPPKREMLRATR
jgi:tRNA U34 5-methylaminomethyl-2-thiouridine-forming methyltransferase MnmC